MMSIYVVCSQFFCEHHKPGEIRYDPSSSIVPKLSRLIRTFDSVRLRMYDLTKPRKRRAQTADSDLFSSTVHTWVMQMSTVRTRKSGDAGKIG